MLVLINELSINFAFHQNYQSLHKFQKKDICVQKLKALCPTRSYPTPSDKKRASQLRSGLHTIKTTQSSHFSILRLQTQLSQEKLFQDVPIWVKRGRTEGVADSRAYRGAPSLLRPSINSRVGPGPQEDPEHPQGQQGLEALDQEKLTCGSGCGGPSCGDHETDEGRQEPHIRPACLHL